ncbi:hypothetical protein pb186bvf_011517 [Paramecium bursaria]
MGFEEAIPPIPDRQQELRYIHKVEESFRAQPLYKLYMNEALRTRKMEYAENYNKFRKNWWVNFFYSGLIFGTLFYIPVSYAYRADYFGIPFIYKPYTVAISNGGAVRQQFIKRFKLLAAVTTVFAWSYATRVADWSLIEDEYLEDYGPRVPKFD